MVLHVDILPLDIKTNQPTHISSLQILLLWYLRHFEGNYVSYPKFPIGDTRRHGRRSNHYILGLWGGVSESVEI